MSTAASRRVSAASFVKPASGSAASSGASPASVSGAPASAIAPQPAIGACSQAPEAQESAVQSSRSSHVSGTCEQLPSASHVSAVQSSASSQRTRVSVQRSVVVLQRGVVHALPSASVQSESATQQPAIGLAVHLPAPPASGAHRSTLHGSRSSQSPSPAQHPAIGRFVQTPVPRSQRSAVHAAPFRAPDGHAVRIAETATAAIQFYVADQVVIMAKRGKLRSVAPFARLASIDELVQLTA